MGRNGYQHMVLDHLVVRLRLQSQKRLELLRAVNTAEEARAYQDRVRLSARKAFGPLPPKTPLNAKVTGKLVRPNYAIENVMFESRPGCIVTGNLYLPEDRSGPAPCVLGPCGHEKGKDYLMWQSLAQRLVAEGFVVLVYDPFDQGERRQYVRLDEPASEAVRTSVLAHNMVGKQLELLGEWFGMWRAWDGIRALDYLLSREEVDTERVGLTGNSGGGTMTTWLWALDDRFTMAAPSCFITTFLHNLENEVPVDAEQYPPGILAEDAELVDFMVVGAPKPVILLGQAYDYFDPRGLRQAHAELSRIYRAMGAPAENLDLFVGSEGHGYSPHLQEAMVRFFCKHSGLVYQGLEQRQVEELQETELWATPEGNTVGAGSMPIYELISAKARETAETRGRLKGALLKSEVRRLLTLPERSAAAPYYRVLRPVRQEGATFARFAIETEADIRALLWKGPTHQRRCFTLEVEPEVRLYLPHSSTEKDLAGESMALSLLQEHPLYLLDARGLGESAPEESTGGFFQSYGMDYVFHEHSVMLGESYLGKRVFDVLRTVDLLVNQGADTVHLYGRGQGALLALFAALFHENVSSVTLTNYPQSYLEWTQVPVVTWPAASAVRGMLQVCDLDDCMELLGTRLRLIEPWGPAMEPEPTAGC